MTQTTEAAPTTPAAARVVFDGLLPRIVMDDLSRWVAERIVLGRHEAEVEAVMAELRAR